MKRARGNYSLRPTNLAENDAKIGLQAYKDWHWGIPASEIRDWDEPDMPKMLVGCGHIARFHVRAPLSAQESKHPRRHRDNRIQFPHSVMMQSAVGFDNDHPKRRLYFLTPKSVQPFVIDRFWERNTADPIALGKLAVIAGGRNHLTGYPNVVVKPLGALTGIMYYTKKNEPDGKWSYYLHMMGEVSGGFPILAVDQQGRFWCAGGSYTTPNPGIAD